MADMEIAVGLGREARDAARVAAGFKIGADDVADEILPRLLLDGFDSRHSEEGSLRGFAGWSAHIRRRESDSTSLARRMNDNGKRRRRGGRQCTLSLPSRRGPCPSRASAKRGKAAARFCQLGKLPCLSRGMTAPSEAER